MSLARRRLDRLTTGDSKVRARPSAVGLAGTGWARSLAAALVGTQLALYLGGVPGAVAGLLVGLALWRWLGRLEPVSVRRRRERVQADLPLAVDLLVACLRAGRPVGAAARAVADAVGGPLGADLARWSARLELAGEPRASWDEQAADPVLGPLARAVRRAYDTGVPLAECLTHLVDDLQRDRRTDAEEVARRVAVRSAGPLGLCFLPAFVLVGVVPTVIGAFSGLLG